MSRSVFFSGPQERSMCSRLGEPNKTPALQSEENCIYVVSTRESCRYKLVLRGSVSHLTIGTIRSHLEKATGRSMSSYALLFNGRLLESSASGTIPGLQPGSVLHLALRQTSSRPSPVSFGVQEKSINQASDAKRSDQLVSSESCLSLVKSPSPKFEKKAKICYDQHPTVCCSESKEGTHRQSNSGSSGRKGDSNGLSQSLSSSEPDAPLLPAGRDLNAVVSSTRISLSDDSSDRIEKLEKENLRLRAEVEQWKAECAKVRNEVCQATSDWMHEDELHRLQEALKAQEQHHKDMVEATHARWELKENNLIRELDRCREERRRMREEREDFEKVHMQQISSLQVELRLKHQELDEQRKLVENLRLELGVLQSRLNPNGDDEIRNHPFQERFSRDRSSKGFPPSSSLSGKCFDLLVEEAIVAVGKCFGVSQPIVLSKENTAVLEVRNGTFEEGQREYHQVFLYLHTKSEQLFLYATLLDYLPRSADDQRSLYEMLLEGNLLSRQVAGGAVGISMEDNLVLLSVSVDLRHSDAEALAVKVKPFLECFLRWRDLLQSRFPIEQ